MGSSLFPSPFCSLEADVVATPPDCTICDNTGRAAHRRKEPRALVPLRNTPPLAALVSALLRATVIQRFCHLQPHLELMIW